MICNSFQRVSIVFVLTASLSSRIFNISKMAYWFVIVERFSIAFTAKVRLKFPVYQKLVKFILFQLMFYLLVTAMEQVLKTEK